MSLYLVRDAVEEFHNRLQSSLNSVDFYACFDETQLRDMLRVESSKIMDEIISKIDLFHPEMYDAKLEELNAELEKVMNLYLAKNEQSLSFSRRLKDILSNKYRSSCEMQLCLHPYMEMECLRNVLQRGRSEVIKRMGEWTPWIADLEETLTHIQRGIEEKHRSFLQGLLHEDRKIFYDLQEGLLEKSEQFKNAIANLQAGISPKCIIIKQINEMGKFVFDKGLFRLAEFVNIHKQLLEILKDAKTSLYKAEEKEFSENAFISWTEDFVQQLRDCSAYLPNLSSQAHHRGQSVSMHSYENASNLPDASEFDMEVNHFRPPFSSTSREQENVIDSVEKAIDGESGAIPFQNPGGSRKSNNEEKSSVDQIMHPKKRSNQEDMAEASAIPDDSSGLKRPRLIKTVISSLAVSGDVAEVEVHAFELNSHYFRSSWSNKSAVEQQQGMDGTFGSMINNVGDVSARDRFRPPFSSTSREQENLDGTHLEAMEALGGIEVPRSTRMQSEDYSQSSGHEAMTNNSMLEVAKRRSQNSNDQEHEGPHLSRDADGSIAFKRARLNKTLIPGSSWTTSENEHLERDLENEAVSPALLDKSMIIPEGTSNGAMEESQDAVVRQEAFQNSEELNRQEDKSFLAVQDDGQRVDHHEEPITESRRSKRKFSNTPIALTSGIDQNIEAVSSPPAKQAAVTLKTKKKKKPKVKVPQICPFCRTTTFPSAVKLGEHLKKVHYACTTCGMFEKNKRTLGRHQATHDTGAKMLNQCGICLGTFSTKSTLDRHMRCAHKPSEVEDRAPQEDGRVAEVGEGNAL